MQMDTFEILDDYFSLNNVEMQDISIDIAKVAIVGTLLDFKHKSCKSTDITKHVSHYLTLFVDTIPLGKKRQELTTLLNKAIASLKRANIVTSYETEHNNRLKIHRNFSDSYDKLCDKIYKKINNPRNPETTKSINIENEDNEFEIVNLPELPDENFNDINEDNNPVLDHSDDGFLQGLSNKPLEEDEEDPYSLFINFDDNNDDENIDLNNTPTQNKNFETMNNDEASINELKSNASINIIDKIYHDMNIDSQLTFELEKHFDKIKIKFNHSEYQIIGNLIFNFESELLCIKINLPFQENISSEILEFHGTKNLTSIICIEKTHRIKHFIIKKNIKYSDIDSTQILKILKNVLSEAILIQDSFNL